jgi:ComF family protein
MDSRVESYVDRGESVSWRERLWHFFLPATCLGCTEPLWHPRHSLGLCPKCRARLRSRPATCCALCARPLAASTLPESRCASCRAAAPSYRTLLWAWAYQPPLDAVIVALKFRRLDYLGAQLGKALASNFREQLAEIDLVTALPLHWRRRWWRGYNQAELIARPLARVLDKPFRSCLRRPRAGKAQSLSNRRERTANVRNAFSVCAPAAIRGRHVLLVDDVTTTGATLEAAAACLRRGGAATVTALVVARAPAPDDPT